MVNYENLTTFAGLPVVDFVADGPNAPALGAMARGATAVADPSAVAWRVSQWEDEDGWEDAVSEVFVAAFEAFLASPVAPLTTTLVLGTWGYAAFNLSPVEVVSSAAARLPALRHLFFGDITSEECEISWIKQGDITPLLTAYPALETLRVRGGDGLALVPLRHAGLRSLAFETGGLPPNVIRAVGECDLPELRHLELFLGTAHYGGNAIVDDFSGILSGLRLPKLAYLGLRDAEIADLIAAAVASAPVVGRVSTLDLSLGMLTDDGAAALLSGQPLTHLSRLDLHHHFLSEAMMSRLREELEPAGVELDISEAEGADKSADERYVAVAE